MGCFPRAAVAALFALALSGCTRSRVVTVEVPTRTAVVTAPPDTVIRWRAVPLDTTGRRSRPLAVERYVSADTSAAVPVVAIVQTDSTIEVRTAGGSQVFRSPDCGSGQVATYTPSAPGPLGPGVPGRNNEADSLEASRAHPRAGETPGGFDARVRGEPKPREVTVACPACAKPVVGSGLWGWLKLLGLLAVAFVAGAVIGPLLIARGVGL